MDFRYSEAEEEFRRALVAWLEEHWRPERVWGSGGQPAAETGGGGRTGRFERMLAWHRELHSGGWVGIWWPREWGGRGASLAEQAIFHEEMQRRRIPLGVNGVGINLLGPTLMRWGTDEQKRRFLPRILPAEELWCQGYSEPGAGSDLAALQTKAELHGDTFVVNGQKLWTSGAHHADWIFLLARTDPTARRHRGISYLLVDMHSPGISVRPLVQMTGDRGFNEVFFEDVRVPRANLVGELNQGWKVALTTLALERAAIGQFFQFERLVHRLARLARSVDLGGRPAWENAEARQRIAQFAIEAQALRCNEYRRLTRQLRGAPPGPEGSVTKLCSSELYLRIASFATELLGSHAALVRGSPFAVDRGSWMSRMLGARGYTMGGGTSEVQRNIIGERLLGLPKGDS